jgi:hypothetical protein
MSKGGMLNRKQSQVQSYIDKLKNMGVEVEITISRCRFLLQTHI